MSENKTPPVQRVVRFSKLLNQDRSQARNLLPRLRSRHELAEKIRQLTQGTKKEPGTKLGYSNIIEMKHELKRTAQIHVSPRYQMLKPTVFYQPLVHSQETHEKNVITYVYVMPEMETNTGESEGSQPARYLVSQRIKVRRKKKRSSTFSRIEDILSRGKDILTLPEPSEESIVIELNEEEQETKQKDISSLPEDLLQNIFWCFSLKERCIVLSRVCKTWNYILKNPIFWRHLEFAGDRVPTPVILSLIAKSPLLRSLKLVSVPEASIILHELCRETPGLKELIVRDTTMNRIDCIHVLLQIISSLPDLEVLDLHGTEFKSKRFYTELCLLKNLKSLSLGANRYLQPRDLMTVSVNCRDLETLEVLDIPSNVRSGDQLTDENFSYMLQNLHRSLAHFSYDMQHLRNSAYLAILMCTKLNSLCLTNCLFLTGNMFRKFHRLTQLKDLTLTRAINLTSEDFESLFDGSNLSNIERLNINGCWKIDQVGLNAIARALPYLKKLSLENCKSIKGVDLKRILRGHGLSFLNVANSGVDGKELPGLARMATGLRLLTIDRKMYESSPVRDFHFISPQLSIEIND